MKNKIALRTAFSFLVLLVFLAGFTTIYKLAWKNTDGGAGVPKAFRATLESNGKIWQSLFRFGSLSRPHLPPPEGEAPRVNGDIGLGEKFDPKGWKLTVIASDKDPQAKRLEFSMEDLKKLPRSESNAEFRCIEGWSEPIQYAGVKFSDFLRLEGIGSPWGAPAIQGELMPKDLYAYVGLETPDGEYYVSIDMESMLHPQTMLAYEMNGMPLDVENGAPLRLIIPTKYGIKNLKRIGKIFFSPSRPRDYWAEQGYDWFAGL
jgi:hypothetical protein